MSQAEMILDQVDVVKLDINLWTSSKKLRAEDLVLADGSKLPPEDLASLGTKKTIHPDKLKEFNRIKVTRKKYPPLILLKFEVE